jgi:hypothetical protein
VSLRRPLLLLLPTAMAMIALEKAMVARLAPPRQALLSLSRHPLSRLLRPPLQPPATATSVIPRAPRPRRLQPPSRPTPLSLVTLRA